MKSPSFRRALLTLFSIALFSSGVASAAPPGTPELRPNDPGYQGYPGPLNQVDAPEFWAATVGQQCTAKVAVLDSAPAAIPDLPFQAAGNFAPEGGDTEHGTEVASVIGAGINNGIGIAGLTNCPVLAVRAVDASGHWQNDWLAPAVDLAASQPGVRVINISLYENAGETASPQVQAAIQNAKARGILVVLIAGNGVNNQGPGSAEPSANPLASANPAAIRVAGVDPSGALNPRSNHGAGWVDVAAPYVMPVDLPDGSWSPQGGTSYAAPVVSAIAAEMFTINPSLTPDDVERKLMDTCTKTGIDVACGGVVNAFNALVAAGYQPPPSITLRIEKAGSGSGAVSVSSCGTAATCTLAPGAVVQLAADADEGSVFAGWSGAAGCSKPPTCTLTATADVTVTATFDKVKVPLTVEKTGRGMVTSVPAGIACGLRCRALFTWGSAVRLTAKPTKGYVVRWGGACRSKPLTCRIAGLKKPALVRAVFVKQAVKR